MEKKAVHFLFTYSKFAEFCFCLILENILLTLKNQDIVSKNHIRQITQKYKF